MSKFVEAKPNNGDVTHAIWASSVTEGARFSHGRALCGVRGRDAWAYGGMIPSRDAAGALIPFTAKDPNPEYKTGWDGRWINSWCPKCIVKVRMHGHGDDAA